MILLIDTSDFNNLHLALINTEKNLIKEARHTVAYNENYKTAGFLNQFLKKTKTKPKELSKIVVCSGPGSFTGIRVGVALAQGLGFGLGVPVIAIPKTKIPKNIFNLTKIKSSKKLVLHYGRPANITKPKK